MAAIARQKSSRGCRRASLLRRLTHMSDTGETNRVGGNGASAEDYVSPEAEQTLRADLEETWQSESPATARQTEFADEVDGRIGTRPGADTSED